MKKAANTSASAMSPFFAKIESLTKRQRIVVYALTLLVMVGIAIPLLYLPKYKTLNKLNTEYEDLSKKITVAKKNAKDLKKFRARREKARAEFNIAKNKLPEKNEIPALLTSISESGQDVGLQFLLFAPQAEKRKDFYAEIPVSIKITGSYHNVALFFDRVAHLPRIVNMRNISITPKNNNSMLSTTCKAITYRFVEKPVKTKGKGKKKTRKKR